MIENLELKDIVIVGAGPAGLSAALYVHRTNKKLILIESHAIGGQLNWAGIIENYPGFPNGINGMDLAQKMKEQVEGLSIKAINVKVESIKEDKNLFVIKTGKEAFKAKAVIIATGATAKRLGVPNEDRFIGKGVSFCGTCDGPLFKNKEVIVIGGGDVALEEALFLTQFAKKVILMHRRDEFRALPILQKRIKDNKKIEVLCNHIPVEIIGNVKVEAIKIKDKKTNQIKDLNVDGIFIFVGSRPNSEIVKQLVNMDEDGFIITDDNMQTSKEGIFAAGDVRKKKDKQIILACSEGAQAALSAYRYIDED